MLSSQSHEQDKGKLSGSGQLYWGEHPFHQVGKIDCHEWSHEESSNKLIQER